MGVAGFAFDAVKILRKKKFVMLLVNAGAKFTPLLAGIEDEFDGTTPGHGRVLLSLYQKVSPDRQADDGESKGDKLEVSGGTCDNARAQMNAALSEKDGRFQSGYFGPDVADLSDYCGIGCGSHASLWLLATPDACARGSTSYSS